ncbi:MAG: T9SS type A sorting domain-containing protein [Bacteroidia bacterium]|nr:T9SS type A sorting domain-containing protein [Bacteroidia bacterium]
MKKLLYLQIAFALSTVVISQLSAQNEPFNCSYSAYLFQYNDIYSVDLATGNSYVVASDVTEGNINAAAYNPQDGFLWGSLSSPSKTIVRIGADFNTETFYIEELPTSNRYVGDINPDGIYYLKGGGTTFYKIDLNPNSPSYSEFLATGTLSQGISIHDWAFNSQDGQLYTVEKNTNKLYRINPETNEVYNLGEVPILSGFNYTYGAVYFDAAGNFYVSSNQTGTIYIISNVQNLNGSDPINSNLFAFGPSSSSNDGARCPTAPVPLENCSNGIDDDGDGLSDCDDPSCSGVSNCPTLDAFASGANDGGLESNNRLSDQIMKRKYKRLKSNYTFDKTMARRVDKKSNYNQRTSNFTLSDLIPLNIIAEDYVIESSPTDLIDITNATDLFSVDYIKNEESVASILLLRTEESVYEHTKYICDRLLGAELLSVSTLDINGHSFIKAIIKNTDGTLEFVLSLAAKAVNSDGNFEVESHWNLDKYEAGAAFYNFQIWSNSVDDLLLLATEVIDLLNTQKPITAYNLSTPPTVFVKKGSYNNGQLHLEIINTNNTDVIDFDAGFRETETSSFQNLSSSITLNQSYIKNVDLNVGSLFDLGFRIGDNIETPDDVFLSDGPWGIDDYASDSVDFYDISPNEETFDFNEFGIERNLKLIASTSAYISAFRALTPRFKAVDLSNYNTLKFKGKGSGVMEIRLIKDSISVWEHQYMATVVLSENLTDYEIQLSDFSSANYTDALELNDIVSIIFTMVSEDGTSTVKEMDLRELRFSNSNTLSQEEITDNNRVQIIPNPITDTAIISLYSRVQGPAKILIYDALGRIIKSFEADLNVGQNRVDLNRDNLNSGIYFCKVTDPDNQFKTVRILIR